MSIGIGSGGAFPSPWGSTTRNTQNYLPQKPEFEFSAYPRESLSQALADAIKEWKDKMLKGLNSLTEEDIQEKLAEFREAITRENATEEELEEIDRLVRLFEDVLRNFAEQQHTEALITTPKDPEREQDRNSIARFIMAQITHDPLQTQREAEHTVYHSKQMAGRYESMLSDQGSDSSASTA
ncbi:MAG: hypothetical protein FWE20_08980 [Defluviitaleaceae bacterium]|nr:hypothetical protein [Defluviitaleaceae bacterium]